jgi:hypothetical protein
MMDDGWWMVDGGWWMVDGSWLTVDVIVIFHHWQSVTGHRSPVTSH